MSPQQTVKNYQAAFDYFVPRRISSWELTQGSLANVPRLPSSWEMVSNQMVRSANGLGASWWEDAVGAGKDIASNAVNQITAPAQEKLDRLEMAIKAILVLSGIAAVTGTINLLRK